MAQGAVMRLAANASLDASQRFSGMVTMNGTAFSAVRGGTFDASGVVTPPGRYGYHALAILDGKHNSIRDVRAVAFSNTSCIGVNGGQGHEVAYCDVGGSPVAPAPTRCIWTLATQNALVHDNYVHHCKVHALDFDAYTSASVAHSNICEDNGMEGIFVEETASGNFVYNNTCARNRNGIGVYSNAVGPVANNVFVGNTLVDNTQFGITAGGYGHDPTKNSNRNIFLGNRGGPFNIAHGANIGDYWMGNEGAVMGAPAGAANVSVFDP